MSIPFTTDAGFARATTSSSHPVLVIFESTAAPCPQDLLTGALSAAHDHRFKLLRVIRVNIDHAPRAAQDYGVSAGLQPTLMLLADGGQQVSTLRGQINAQTLSDWIETSFRKKDAPAKSSGADAGVVLNITPTYLSIAFRILGGGGALVAAATATAPIGLVIGIIAATGSLLRIVAMLADVDHARKTAAALSQQQTVYINNDKIDSASAPARAAFAVFATHPATRIVFAGATVAAGVMLWPLGGFMVGALAAGMVTAGSFGLMSATAALALRGVVKKLAALAKEAKAEAAAYAQESTGPYHDFTPGQARPGFDQAARTSAQPPLQLEQRRPQSAPDTPAP